MLYYKLAIIIISTAKLILNIYHNQTKIYKICSLINCYIYSKKEYVYYITHLHDYTLFLCALPTILPLAFALLLDWQTKRVWINNRYVENVLLHSHYSHQLINYAAITQYHFKPESDN